MLSLSGEKKASVHYLRAQKEDPHFRYFNPSVAVVNDRIFASWRKANVERSDVTGKAYILRPHTDLKNELIIGEFDADFTCTRQIDIVCADRKTGRPYNEFGFEDSRLFASPQGTLEGVTCLPCPKHEILSDQEMTFAPDFSLKIARIEFGPDFQIAKFTPYESPLGRRKEKNWSAFYREGKLCVVYQWNPLIVMTLEADGATRFIKWFHPSPQLSDLRGGSPGIATKNGYLFVVHRRFQLADKLRFTHQFLELNHHLQPQRLSKEFSFLSTGLIEYCAGLAQLNDRYLLTFGLNDSLPFLLQVHQDSVEKWLQPFPEPIVENKTILNGSPDEQLTAAAVDFPRDFELGRIRLAKLRVKELLNRARGGHLRA